MTERYLRLLTIIVIILSLSFTSHTSAAVEVTIEDNSITINWNGNTRLSGGLPHLEAVEFITQSVNEKINEMKKIQEISSEFLHLTIRPAPLINSFQNF